MCKTNKFEFFYNIYFNGFNLFPLLSRTYKLSFHKIFALIKFSSSFFSTNFKIRQQAITFFNNYGQQNISDPLTRKSCQSILKFIQLK